MVQNGGHTPGILETHLDSVDLTAARFDEDASAVR